MGLMFNVFTLLVYKIRFVCLSVCLSVNKITRKVVDQFSLNCLVDEALVTN